jgi:hypothetical protein
MEDGRIVKAAVAIDQVNKTSMIYENIVALGKLISFSSLWDVMTHFLMSSL